MQLMLRSVFWTVILIFIDLIAKNLLIWCFRNGDRYVYESQK
ncbi:hypothetical protein [Desmonostoc muscorum]|nr:hypothetical protein [Desmonostoc muscorum]